MTRIIRSLGLGFVATVVVVGTGPAPVTANPASLPAGVWDLAADFGSPNAQAYGIGPEGVWAYGDDVGETNDLSGFTAYNSFADGLWSFGNDPFPPGALLATLEAGTPESFYSHEADGANPTRASVAVWTAPRTMSIALSVAVWTPADGIQNSRAHDVSWRCHAADGRTVLSRADDRVGPGSAHTNYATRWRSASSMTVQVGQTVSVWHSRRDVQGFVGVDFKVTELGPSYLTDLGTLGGSHSTATAINNVGEVVGFSQTSDGETHAFLYSNGEMRDLGTLGGDFSMARAVNRHGQVVGHARTASGDTHAFLYSDGAMIDLGTLGGPSSGAIDINDEGEVTGSSDVDRGIHGFLYADGVMTDVGTLVPGGGRSLPRAINANGVVVGSATSLSGERAFAYEDGVIRDLGDLGGQWSSAWAINASGEVVGEARTSGGETHAFLYSAGVMADLGSLGGSFSRALDVNAAGDVVGESSTASSSFEPHAFLHADGEMLDLGTLGGRLSVARFVNSRRQVVGSSRIVYDPGDDHAFLWQEGAMIDLGTLGGPYSIPNDLNDRGQVVGVSATATGAAHAFIAELGDTLAPTIDCPGDISVEATGPDGATVSYVVTATDVDDPAPAVVCNPASGSTFPLGPTTVTCTATDSSGNVSECSFVVSVVDTRAPSLACPDDLVVEASGADGTVVGYVAPTAVDVVSGEVLVACNPPTGATFPLGITTVSCQAIDGRGNRVECSFRVVVRDTTPPTLDCPQDRTVLATQADGAVVTFTTTAWDAVDETPEIDYSVRSGSTFPVGTTMVLVTVRDDFGNEASCAFGVTVRSGADESTSLAEDLDGLDPSGDAQVDAWVDRAVEYLEASGSSDLWVDATHLSESGKLVFQQQEAAIRSLAKIADPDPTVLDVIHRTLDLDRVVVETAIAECQDASRRLTAEAHLQASLAAAAEDDYVKAVREMGLAWKAAQKS